MLPHPIRFPYVLEKMPLVGVTGTDDADKLKRACTRGLTKDDLGGSLATERNWLKVE